jgi:hypothetical protein
MEKVRNRGREKEKDRDRENREKALKGNIESTVGREKAQEKEKDKERKGLDYIQREEVLDRETERNRESTTN